MQWHNVLLTANSHGGRQQMTMTALSTHIFTQSLLLLINAVQHIQGDKKPKVLPDEV